MSFNVTPLPHEWMIISIIGFFVSWLYIYNILSFEKWGAAFALFFVMMFIASIVNMSAAGLEDEHVQALSGHKRR